MRRGWALLLTLLLAPLAGCLTAKSEPSSNLQTTLLPFTATEVEQQVVLEVSLLETAVNDPYVNGPLWDLVDETANAGRKSLLHDNGWRHGNLGPTPPDRLIDLMLADRNAANVRQRRLPPGTPAALPIGPACALCRYDLKKDGDTIPVELEQAQCALEVVPVPNADGSIKLTFTPVVQYGEKGLLPKPVQDPSGVLRWALQEAARPSERYGWLSWEMNVVPNEYVVVGTQAARADTLGQRAFLQTETLAPVQRLLVLRVVSAPRPGSKAVEPGKRPPPLALQALRSSVRGLPPGQ